MRAPYLAQGGGRGAAETPDFRAKLGALSRARHSSHGPWPQPLARRTPSCPEPFHPCPLLGNPLPKVTSSECWQGFPTPHWPQPTAASTTCPATAPGDQRASHASSPAQLLRTATLLPSLPPRSATGTTASPQGAGTFQNAPEREMRTWKGTRMHTNDFSNQRLRESVF